MKDACAPTSTCGIFLGGDTKRAHEGRMRTYVHLHREQRRRASGFDARNRGTQGVPQVVRAKRVRPFHIRRIRTCGYVHNRMRTYVQPAASCAHAHKRGLKAPR